MTKKTRLIILLICVLFFLVITPSIVLYSLGYRVDFEQKRIVATGGVYLKVWPQPAEIFIDSKLGGKTNMFSGSVFVPIFVWHSNLTYTLEALRYRQSYNAGYHR